VSIHGASSLAENIISDVVAAADAAIASYMFILQFHLQHMRNVKFVRAKSLAENIDRQRTMHTETEIYTNTKCSLSTHSWTLTCSLIVCRLMVSNPIIHVNVITDPRGVELGSLGWPNWLTHRGHFTRFWLQRGHLSTTDQAQSMESPPAKDRRPPNQFMA